MKRFIFMNHRIREPKPKGPVIVHQSGQLQRFSNRLKLYVDGRLIGEVRYSPRGNRSIASHSVRAWVELQPCVNVLHELPKRRRRA